ncbi:[protein-PII] uridylyltransferase [Myxococcota bacterium]|nr:[protein-PII] uridylyltransferase [Myxococcota bacterium]
MVSEENVGSAPLVEDFLSERDALLGGASSFDREITESVQAYISAHQEYVINLHSRGEKGGRLNRINSDGIDRLIRRLVRSAESLYYASGGEAGESVAGVAVGGYGRRELSVHSDIDLLFLHGAPLTSLASIVAERIQHWLWDAGMKVGSAVRSAQETIRLAKADGTVATNVLDARFLGGETRFYHDLQSGVWRDLIRNPRDFLQTQVSFMEERHEKFGQSVYLLQPNVKEGAGGLRDYHTAYWVARATVPSLSSANDMLHRGLLTEGEMIAYDQALQFLWRVRNELHVEKGSAVDQMSFEDQELVATRFGYQDEGPGELPVEQFMRDYYRHARSVRSGSQSVIEEARLGLDKSARKARSKTISSTFELSDGMLHIPYAAKVIAKPARIMEAFAISQEYDVTLSRSAQRVIREHLDLIDSKFREDTGIGCLFDKILSAPQRVAHALMAMNEIGVLSAYLPEWEHIVCRWQHVMYHTYTVDVHSIFLVQELRRLWLGDHKKIAPDLTRLIRTSGDRAVVIWGCLLHDIGKGFGGDHSDRGAQLAENCLARLGVSKERRERVVFLVKYHLLMSHVAQRRDLSDLKVIMEFSDTVGDLENLDNLYLVTFADIRASSPGAWNEWKGQLLQELYDRVADYLARGKKGTSIVEEQLDHEYSEKRASAIEEIRLIGLKDDEVVSLFEDMPRRYFLSHTVSEIARHAEAVARFEKTGEAIVVTRELSQGHSEVVLCMRDSEGLYSQVAGLFTLLGVNILDSQVYTTKTEIALEVYRVRLPKGGVTERELLWGEFELGLKKVQNGEEGLLAQLRSNSRLSTRRVLSHRPDLKVEISNVESELYTVIDVTTDDRPGLLYDLTRVLASRGLDIHVSKASTVLDQVADTFYVLKRDGLKLENEGELARVKKELIEIALGGSNLE